jgi:transcriptional regulator with XRE-family HTH domain
MRKNDSEHTKKTRDHIPEIADGETLDVVPRPVTKHEFGRTLHGHLAAKGWNQSDLARYSGLTRDSVSRYLLGKSFPRPPALRAMAKALGLNPEQLLGNYVIDAIREDPASFDIKTSVNAPNMAWLRVERMVSLSTALKIGQLLQDDEKTDGK